MSMDAVELAQALIRIPTVTPMDNGCQSLLRERLAALGFVIHPLRHGEVENFYARLGTEGKNFCFAGHTDVVPPGQTEQWQSDPFGGEIRDGALWGRGVCDMKGGVAAMVAAMTRFLTRYPDFPKKNSLSLLITGDEEGAAVNGTVRVVEWLQERGERLDYCLVGEPTSVDQLGDCLKIGRRGSLNGEIHFHGIQGHVAYPHLARNPIHAALSALAKLAHTPVDTGNDHFPPSTLQIVGMRSGDGVTNVIPAELKVWFNIRFNPLHTAESLEQHLRTILNEAEVPYTLMLSPPLLPFLAATGGVLPEVLRWTIQQRLGVSPDFSTGGGTSDARFLVPICPETVEFGLLARTIHQVDERCAVQELQQLSEIYEALLCRLFVVE